MTESASLPRNVSGYVLAGGRSSRMGRDKALLEVDGEPLVERALSRLRPLCAHVRILSGPPDFHRNALLSSYAQLVPDAETTHAGPLAALSAALQDCTTPYALLLAVDQPGIATGELHRLIHAGTTASAVAACYMVGGRAEPLPLLASRDLGPEVRRALAAGEHRLLPAVQGCVAELRQEMLFLPPLAASQDSFINLNTPADLHQWQVKALSNQSAPSASETGNGR